MFLKIGCCMFSIYSSTKVNKISSKYRDEEGFIKYLEGFYSFFTFSGGYVHTKCTICARQVPQTFRLRRREQVLVITPECPVTETQQPDLLTAGNTDRVFKRGVVQTVSLKNRTLERSLNGLAELQKAMLQEGVPAGGHERRGGNLVG